MIFPLLFIIDVFIRMAGIIRGSVRGASSITIPFYVSPLPVGVTCIRVSGAPRRAREGPNFYTKFLGYAKIR